MDFIELIKLAPPGPRLEIGVFRGDSLLLMATTGEKQRTIGVDSFEGMPEPGEYDDTNYPKGRLAVSQHRVRCRMPKHVELIKGFVPEVLSKIPNIKFSFVHLDIDHYATTRAALFWLFPKMKPGGIICCDDWFQNKNILAAKAINEMAELIPLTDTFEKKAYWIT